ncbi:MAG: aldolase catalytic domain-containing protein [Euryarchaeota archaeon]|nr:aldolase catalytic domain-containing protein [Euryarchaeota archaeon]
MKSSSPEIKILDCTIRDGGYINNWQFDKGLVREVYRALSKSGVDIVEIGYRGSEKYFDPKKYGRWRFTSEEDMQDVIGGIKGSKIALMGDYGKIDLEHLSECEDSMADVIRIAVHKNNAFKAIALLEKIKEKGYETSLQTMGFTSYTLKERDELKNAIEQSNMDYFYIADSYGSIFPNQIRSIFEPFLELDNIKLGFHPHNSLQMAFANTLEAINVGVDIVDGSIYGMGRGAGNLPIETLIAYMQMQSRDRYNVIPILNVLDKYFIEIKKKNPWGYQLPYMLSGMFKCHPYYAKDLVDRREYSIEDIWKVMEIIEEMNPVGFDRSIVQNLIEKGIIGRFDQIYKSEEKLHLKEHDNENKVHVPYINQHAGRDFLVLANGPSLKEYKDRINLFIKKYNPIILGANYLGGMFVPHYHAFNNKKRFTMYGDTVDSRSKLLIGENIPQEMITEYINFDYETLYFRDVLDSNFAIQNGRLQSNCRTISVLLIGVAIVMGANRIFVAGMDGYTNTENIKKSLFYDEKVEPTEEAYLLERQQWNELFLNQIEKYLLENGKEGIHILTPTSHRSYYKGITNYI